MAEIDIQKRRTPMWPWIFGIAIAVILIILLITTRDTTDVASPYGAGPDFPERPQPVIPPGQPMENQGIEEQPGPKGTPQEWRDDRPGEPGTPPTLRPGVQPDPSPEGPRGGGPFNGTEDPMSEGWMEENEYFSDEELYGRGEDYGADDVEHQEESEGDGAVYGTDVGSESSYAPAPDEDRFQRVETPRQGAQGVASYQGAMESEPLSGENPPGAQFFDDEAPGEAVEPVEDFARFIEESSGDRDVAPENVYAAHGAQHLVAALASLASQYPVSSVDPVHRRAQIDEQVDMLDDEEFVEDHARVTRNVFADVAQWLRTIQGEYFPDLEGDLDGIDEALAAIDGEGNLLDQSEQVDTFFVRVSDVLHRMQNEGHETYRY